ncbi:MAG TPA: MFS transporter [Terricaulis sp.]|nr:MFS transporter [Terricaulis sp.]
MSKEPEDIRVGAYPYVVVLILGLIYAFNYLDRQIVAILVEPIKADLNLTDTQVGLVSGFAFALFYTTFGIPVAWLADRTNRVRVVAIACFVWSLFTGLCGVAGNFAHLLAARIGVGVGEAGGAAPSMSIISDYFPPHRRGGAISIWSLGVPLGATAGVALGGWAAAEFGWRWAFFAVAAPGIFLSLLLWIFVREPKRGRYDAAPAQAAPQASIMQCIRDYLRNPTLALLLLAAATYSFVFNAFAAWAPALLMRAKGAEMSDIAAYYSIVIGLAMAIGMFLSGFLADRYARKNPSAFALIPAWALAIGVPFFVMGVLADGWAAALIWFAIPMAMNMMFVAPGMAIVQNIAPPSQRSTSAAILLFVNNLVGMGLGPLYIGFMSERLSHAYGAEAGLEYALLSLTPFYPLAVIALVLVARSLARRGFLAEGAAQT